MLGNKDTVAPPEHAIRDPPETEQQFDIGSTADSLERMRELFARFGDIYRVYAPGRKSYTYVINHPDDVRRILVANHRNYTKGIGVDRIKLLLGNGIMTSEGELWKRQRSMMQPSFHRRVITEFARVIDEANERLMARWEAQAASGDAVNVTDDMSELSLNIMLRSIFGRNLDEFSRQLDGNPFEVITTERTRDLAFAYKFRSLTKLVADLVRHRHAQPEEHFDYIQMLMDARDKETGNAMSERELIEEIMTLIVAGHETTASSLSWTWYLLSQHPEVETRLHAELDTAGEQSTPGLAQMEALVYTQQVVNEALRLYPPGWLLSRRAIEPDVLCAHTIPAGADVLFSPYLLHRHPRFWQEPEKFRPERFAPNHSEERPHFAYLPFGAGPRNCIGETFARYEMLMHYYKVARRYRLTYVPDKPVELDAGINLRIKDSLYMSVERR